MFGWRADEVLGSELPTVLEGEREAHRRFLHLQMLGVPHVGYRRAPGSARGWLGYPCAPVDARRCATRTEPSKAASPLSPASYRCLKPPSENIGRLAARELAAHTEFRVETPVPRATGSGPRRHPGGRFASGLIVLVERRRRKRLSGYKRAWSMLGQPIDILTPRGMSAHLMHVGAPRRLLGEPPVTRPMGGGLDLHLRCKDGFLTRAGRD